MSDRHDSGAGARTESSSPPGVEPPDVGTGVDSTGDRLRSHAVARRMTTRHRARSIARTSRTTIPSSCAARVTPRTSVPRRKGCASFRSRLEAPSPGDPRRGTAARAERRGDRAGTGPRRSSTCSDQRARPDRHGATSSTDVNVQASVHLMELIQASTKRTHNSRGKQTSGPISLSVQRDRRPSDRQQLRREATASEAAVPSMATRSRTYHTPPLIRITLVEALFPGLQSNTELVTEAVLETVP
jgi:hypothetical protein